MLTITHGYVTHFKTLLVIFCVTPRICFGAIARYTIYPYDSTWFDLLLRQLLWCGWKRVTPLYSKQNRISVDNYHGYLSSRFYYYMSHLCCSCVAGWNI